MHGPISLSLSLSEKKPRPFSLLLQIFNIGLIKKKPDICNPKDLLIQIQFVSELLIGVDQNRELILAYKSKIQSVGFRPSMSANDVNRFQQWRGRGRGDGHDGDLVAQNDEGNVKLTLCTSWKGFENDAYKEASLGDVTCLNKS